MSYLFIRSGKGEDSSCRSCKTRLILLVQLWLKPKVSKNQDVASSRNNKGYFAIGTTVTVTVTVTVILACTA